MTMRYVDVNLGFTTADAESVQLEFDGCDLTLRCIDWQEKPVRHEFREVLAYRWGQDQGAEGIRDDCAYEVEGSPWLAREAELAAAPPEAYAHYKLCFNACGVLDVLALRARC